MKRTRYLLSILLSLALVLTLAAGAAAAPGQGRVVPELWTAEGEHEWYTVLEAEVPWATGRMVIQDYTFTTASPVSRLTIEDRGLAVLNLTVNGQLLTLTPHLHAGERVTLDLSGFTRYGENTLQLRAVTRPGGSATLRLESPVLAVRLLHINDLHAKIDRLPYVGAYAQQALEEEQGNVIFVNAGDNFSGNPVSDLNDGKPVIELLNAIGTDLMAVGNHEFDHGPENTQARREESDFPWLSANAAVTDPEATSIQPFEPYRILTNEIGQQIAFIGLTETPPSTAKKNVVGLAFTDPVAAAQRYINELRPYVDLIVVVSHNGHDFDVAMAEQLSGADLIIGGHSHTYLSEPVMVNDILIAQVGSDGRYIGDIYIVQDKESLTFYPGAAGDAFTVETRSLTEADPDVQAIVDRWNEEMAAVLEAVIGHTETDLNRDDRYAMDVSIGNLITDAMRDAMESDFAVWNNGGIRASIPAGEITMKDVYTVLPFGNHIWKAEMTGAEVSDLIWTSFTRKDRNQVDLQVSGLSYAVYTKPDGSPDRIDVLVDGQPIDPEQTYTVAISDYVATNPGYFPDGMPTIADMGDVDAIVVGNYIKQLGTLNYAATEGRIKVIASDAALPVESVNFYSTSSLLADDAGTLVPLTDQAAVLVWAESTAYQSDMSENETNFALVAYPEGTPIPLAAMEEIGDGKVVGLGALLVNNGFRTSYQHAQWFTNLLDLLAGAESGTLLIDEGHGFYGGADRFSQIASFLEGRGWTAKGVSELTAEALADADVLLIPTPGAAEYTDAELAALKAYVEGGGAIILASQSDYSGYSNPVAMNEIAAALGSVIRFNSDQVMDDHSNAGANYSPVTDEFSPDYPELLEAR